MKRVVFTSFLILALSLSACKEINSDSAQQEFSVREGSIVVFGGVNEVNALSNYMLDCDRFDNVSGKPEPDGLPDFAGEVIERILLMPGERVDSIGLVRTVCQDSLAYIPSGVELKPVRKARAKYFIMPADTLASSCEALGEECFRVLRFRNAFTHRIAYPQMSSYVAMSDAEGNFVIIDANVGVLSE